MTRRVVNAGSSESAPGEARRLRFARLRNKHKAPSATFIISSFLDERPKTVKKVTPKKAVPQIKAKAPKELRREVAMAALGLTEADVIKFKGE